MWAWTLGKTGARKHWGYRKRRKTKKVTATDETGLPDVVPFRDGGLYVAFLFYMQFY